MEEVTVAAPAAEVSTNVETTPNVTAPENKTAPPSQKEEPKAPEYYEIKINGQPRKYTLEDLKAKASLGEAAHEKFQKATELAKKHESQRDLLKKDFFKVLTDQELGLSKDQIREKFEHWYKENYIDPETMDPREIKLRELERKLQERDEQEKELKAKQEAELRNQEIAKAQESAQQEIINILEKHDLPKTRFAASRVAYWMRQNLKNGYNAPEEVIVQQVRDERNSLVSSMVKESTGQQLVEMLGEELVTKIRKYDIELLKKKLNGGNIENPEQPVTQGEEKRVTTRDVDAYFNKLRQMPNRPRNW